MKMLKRFSNFPRSNMLSRKSRNRPLRAVPRAKTSQNTLQHLHRHPAVTRAVAAAATMTRNQAAVPAAAAVHPGPTTSVQDHPHRVAVAVRKVVVAKRRAGKTRSGERLEGGGMPKKKRGETLQRLNPLFRRLSRPRCRPRTRRLKQTTNPREPKFR